MNHGGLPGHLPKKLSIGCWTWRWIASATAGEPYGDLERCMGELKARGGLTESCVRLVKTEGGCRRQCQRM